MTPTTWHSVHAETMSAFRRLIVEVGRYRSQVLAEASCQCVVANLPRWVSDINDSELSAILQCKVALLSPRVSDTM